MSQPKSIAITIFALIEIIAGGIGSVLLIQNLMKYLVTLSPTTTLTAATSAEGAMAIVSIFMYLPAPMFLSAGIAILISWILGKKVNNMALSFLYFMFLLLVIFHIYTKQYTLILNDIGIFFVSTLPLQWFLNHRFIKEIETKQY